MIASQASPTIAAATHRLITAPLRARRIVYNAMLLAISSPPPFHPHQQVARDGQHDEGDYK